MTFTAHVPSGASVGDYEAHELRDSNGSNYAGNSVQEFMIAPVRAESVARAV